MEKEIFVSNSQKRIPWIFSEYISTYMLFFERVNQLRIPNVVLMIESDYTHFINEECKLY